MTIPELVNRQHTQAWLSGTLTEDQLLERMLPESYLPHRALETHIPEDGKVWLIWNRAYTYYIRRDHRIDVVFEAWRLEQLLDEASSQADVYAAFQQDNITHLLINHRFFLINSNADIEPGRTERIQQRFQGLLNSGMLQPKESWGALTLYAVADSTP